MVVLSPPRTPLRCSRCGEIGHNKRTCGKLPKTPAERSGQQRCSVCGELGHNKRGCTNYDARRATHNDGDLLGSDGAVMHNDGAVMHYDGALSMSTLTAALEEAVPVAAGGTRVTYDPPRWSHPEPLPTGEYSQPAFVNCVV